MNLRVALVVVLFAGCASAASPPTPITGISEIEGRWQGTITLGFNGPEELYWITIHPDGSYVAQWGANWQWGKVMVSGGTATFDVTAPGRLERHRQVLRGTRQAHAHVQFHVRQLVDVRHSRGPVVMGDVLATGNGKSGDSNDDR